MKLCEYCLDYLECQCGQIPLKVHVYVDEDESEEKHTCDWCEDTEFDEMWLTGEDAEEEIKRNPDLYA